MTDKKPLQNHFDLFIFDLDGTLIDSRLDIANAVNVAVENVGLPPLTIDQITELIGGGTRDLVKKALGIHEDRFTQAFDHFSRHYEKHLLDHTILYPGVREILERLDGKTLAVYSNKRKRFCDPILEGLGVSEFFDVVFGGDTASKKKPDPAGIIEICEQMGIPRGRTLMIGDSPIDVEAGKRADVATIGLTCGFTPSKVMHEASADILLDSFSDLEHWLTSPSN